MDRQESLKAALAHEHRAMLPKPWTGHGKWTWVRAIAFVAKADGTRSYAVMEYDGTETTMIADFGTSAIVRSVISLHPTLWITHAELPVLLTDNDIIQYLVADGIPKDVTIPLLTSEGKAPERADSDSREIRRLIFAAAIHRKLDRISTINKYRNRRPCRRRRRRK